ncbi:MAG: T9SS type A sorting domain-containing protein [Bacteroidetes bacterium]|nr:T9SS type A sorting domain-containing protein [Bacteroidota bacterium]
MKKLSFLLLLLCFSTLSFAQFDYVLPVKPGNVWVYKWYDRWLGDIGIYRLMVSDSVQIVNGKIYHEVVNLGNGNKTQYFVRKSEENGYYLLRSNGEELFFNSSSSIGEKWYWGDSTGWSVLTYDIFNSEVFGQEVLVFQIIYDGGVISLTNFYCEKFGLLATNMSESTESTKLMGCIIDGVVYGDTTRTLVGVESDHLKPHTVILGQNYPNPFNPSTTIPFRLTQSGPVKMTVYDISGREIRVLKNEFMAPGNHQVTFQADEFPSGLYLVRLEAEGKVLSKKMMLLK